MVNHRIKLLLTHLTLVVVLASILQVGTVSAQIERRDDLTTLIKKHAVWNPSEFILDKLKANRIVMVGDAEHGDPLYYRVIINSLNEWISACGQSTANTMPKGLPTKLFLILEMNSAATNRLNHYFWTGNPIDIIDPTSFWNQFTTGDFEFYDDLRTVRRRVDEFNRSHGKDSQISFDILGPEKVVDLSSWTREKSDSFFVRERDQYSSAKVRQLLESTPDAKALIYYGEDHLQREMAPKELQKGQVMGYFLAHYLTERFGSEGGVYTCSQVDVAASSWLDRAVAKIGRTFATDDSIFAGLAIEPGASFPRIGDGAIYHFVQPRQLKPMYTLFSETLVDYVLKNIDAYRDSTKRFYNIIVDNWVYYLSNVVTAANYQPLDHSNAFVVDSTIKAWKEWRKSARLDFVEDLSSLQYFKRSVDRIRLTNDPQSTEYEMQLAQLVGFKVWFQNGASPQVRADSIWKFINRYRKPIVIEHLIDLLWVGSNSENQKALAILKKETDKDYNTAKEWTSWWETQQAK